MFHHKRHAYLLVVLTARVYCYCVCSITILCNVYAGVHTHAVLQIYRLSGWLFVCLLIFVSKVLCYKK